MINMVKTFSKSVVKRVIHATGRSFDRIVSDVGDVQPALQLAAELLFAKYPEAILVQIGANDGEHGDPVRDLIVKYDIRALLVEPMPEMCEKLGVLYHAKDRVQICECAVGMESGSLPLHRVRADAPVPAWAHGLASLDRRNIEKHQSWEGLAEIDLNKWIEEVEVAVISFAELLKRFPEYRNADVLQIDTEGHDLEVIRSAMDAGLRPKIVNYEHKHLSIEQQNEARAILAARGFRFLSDSVDTLAVHTSLVDA